MRVRSAALLAFALSTAAFTSVGPERDASASASTAAAEAPTAPPQGALARGAKVTFEPVRKDGGKPISLRARLLSLAVERGETPTPFLEPGAFRATFDTVVTLPARDRLNFRIAGRGKAKLTLNGKVVLDGSLRGNRALETSKPVRVKKGENDLKLWFQSSAMGDGELRLYWSGVDFAFEPIFPELLGYDPADPAVVRGERLRQGLQLFTERRCARCHDFDQRRVTESAYTDLDRAAPDLRSVASRVQAGWLAAWMRDPHELRADVTMPRMPMSDAEANDVGSYLAGLGQPLPHPGFDQQQREQGAVRFRELGCIACHAEPSEQGANATFGGRIPLAFVKQKWHASALVLYLEEPSRHYPDVRMPNLRLDHDDAERLAAYLLEGAAPLPVPAAGDAKKGRRLVQKHGCVLCHPLGDDVPPADRIFPRTRNLHPERGCLAEQGKGGDAPDHAFDDEQRAALRAFLPFVEEVPFRLAPMDFFARHFESDRCYACHAIDGEPSTWMRMVDRLSKQAPLPKEQNPVAQGIPALTWVGAKLQPSWLRRFVLGELPSPRPWLTARMPAFERHGAALADGLVREHGYSSNDEPVRPGDAQLAIFGQRLVAEGTGFACVQCHALGDKPATQVFEREGIELTVARRRLRQEYYMRWMLDPPRIDAESRMTKFANDKGKTPLTDVLGGDAEKQFDAIWHYLGDLAK